MPKEKICKQCGNRFTPRYNSLEKYCSFSCTAMATKDKPKKKRKRIPYRTPKRQAEERIYGKERRVFLEDPVNKFCFVDGCGKPATTVEHIKGRSGEMLLNKEFWRPCCLDHNLEFERNPELSRKYQLSKLHNGSKI